jgi:hypothetical protein
VGALREAATLGPVAAPVTSSVIPYLANMDPHVQMAAHDALVSIGEASIHPLLDAACRADGLGHEESVRFHAMAMDVLRDQGQPSLAPLARMLGKPQGRGWAKYYFEWVVHGESIDSAEAAEIISQRLAAAPDEHALRELMDVVPDLGGNAAKAVPALRHLLQDDRLGISLAALDTLGDTGPAAAAALPDLRRMRRRLRSGHAGDQFMRGYIDEAIHKIER